MNGIISRKERKNGELLIAEIIAEHFPKPVEKQFKIQET